MYQCSNDRSKNPLALAMGSVNKCAALEFFDDSGMELPNSIVIPNNAFVDYAFSEESHVMEIILPKKNNITVAMLRDTSEFFYASRIRFQNETGEEIRGDLYDQDFLSRFVSLSYTQNEALDMIVVLA